MRRYIGILILLLSFGANALAVDADDLEVRVFQPGYGTAESLYKTLREMLTPEGRISFDRRSNQVVVKDTPDNLRRLAQIAGAMTQDAQIEIFVRVIETTNETLRELGLDTQAVVVPGDRLNAVLRFIQEKRDAFFRTEAMVRTTSNYPAALNVTTEEIFGAITVSDSYGRSTTNLYRTPVGTMLEVLPVAHEDGTLTITIQPSSGRVDSDGSIKQRMLRTTIRMNSGDTLVLGGHDSAYEQKYGRGSLRTQWGMRRGRDNVVLFLTARILR